MDNKEVRRRNVEWLVLRHGGPTLFGGTIDRAQSLVTRWGSGKNIGDKAARHIETALGYPTGWLDTRQWESESVINKDAPDNSLGSRLSRLDQSILTQAKRWVQAEEVLAGPYPRDALVDEVLAVYDLMIGSDGVLTAEQRAARFEATKTRSENSHTGGLDDA